MGFATSASSVTLNLQLTDFGRERIIRAGNLTNLFSKFAISDSDIDYRNTQAHTTSQNGFIPGVTGQKTTFRTAINDGYKMRDIIWHSPQSTSVVSTPTKFLAMGMKQQNGTVKYYRDTVVIDFYVHDLFVFYKLLSSRYVANHKDILSTSPTTIEALVKTYYNNKLNLETKGDYLGFLERMSEYGIGTYAEIWDSIKVYDGTKLNVEPVRLISEKDYDYYNSLVLAGGAFIRNNANGNETGLEFDGTNLKGIKQASPFSLFFTPGLNNSNNGYIRGTGAACLGLGAFDWGYLNCGGINSWNQTGSVPYPQFIMNNTLNGWTDVPSDMKNTHLGWIPTVDMESTIQIEKLTNKGYDNISTTIPAARLVLNVATSDLSPTYYPIPPKILTEKNGDYITINSKGQQGIKVTDTTHDSDTTGFMFGQLEYSSNWNTVNSGFKSAAPYFSVFPSKDGGQQTTANRVSSGQDPYYTLLTRMLKMADNMFIGVASQSNSYWKTNTYSGGFKGGLSGSSISAYNFSLPVTWTVQSLGNADAAPLKVTVNFKFNKKAITESILYKNTSSQNYYTLYDNAEFRFYGESGEDLSSYSNDPRGFGYTTGGTHNWQTNTGKQLFRKLISGQEVKQTN